MLFHIIIIIIILLLDFKINFIVFCFDLKKNKKRKQYFLIIMVKKVEKIISKSALRSGSAISTNTNTNTNTKQNGSYSNLSKNSNGLLLKLILLYY